MENISENYKLTIMRELSVEEKAKRYELALERCRKLYNEAKANEYTSDIEDYETIFPELRESEDEKIREIDPYFMTKYIDKGKELTCKDIEIILGIENNILHECNDNSQLVIEAYPKGEDYYGEILRRFNNQRIKPQRIISAEAKEAMYDKPACAWSEEDEKEYKYVLKFVDNILNNCGNKKDYEHSKRCYDWLKSLRPQPKQEWSEEDQNALEDVREAVVHYWGGDTQDILLYWLKSLKQRIKGE